MKKLTTVLMLIAALLVGSATVEAKTTTKRKSTTTKTAKKSSSSVKFGPKIFLKKDSYGNTFINTKGVSSLKQLGFKVTKTLPDIKHEGYFDDASDMWIPDAVNKQYVYSKDGINVRVEQTNKGELEDFTIEFPNSSETEKFVTQMKSAGFKYIYNEGGKDYYFPFSDTAGYYGFVRQNNTITASWGGE